MATKWKDRWFSGRKSRSTEQAGIEALSSYDDGVAERALATAENAAAAVSRLVEVLHERGKLTDSEVQNILGLHGYEVEDGE